MSLVVKYTINVEQSAVHCGPVFPLSHSIALAFRVPKDVSGMPTANS